MSHRILLGLSDLRSTHGGVAHFDRMLCLALDDLAPELGLQVEVVAQRSGPGEVTTAGESWKQLEFVPGGSKLGVARKLFTLALAQRPDLLLLDGIGMTPLGPACLPFLRRGYGFVAHGFECRRDHSIGEKRGSRRAAARRASFVFATSRHAGRELCDWTGLRAGSILPLPNCVSPGFVGCAEDCAAAPAESIPELLSVSRCWSEETLNGLEQAIRAFATLAPRHPRTRYRIVGGGRPGERLQRLAVSLGVGHRVIFEQDLDDEKLAERYRRSAVFVMPWGEEDAGLGFLQAMGFARPCVGGDHDGSAERIVNDETGSLVAFGDEDGLAAALDRLFSAPELRRDLGVAGRRRLLEQFTFERFRVRLEGHLRDLLGLL